MDLAVIAGPNFSGRTAHLRHWVGLPESGFAEPQKTQNAFIGPDPVNSLSGLAPTVLAEFELSARDPDALRDARRAAEQLGFGHILPRNPFTLSGGEQVVAAILAAVAGRPERLAIDCALEQLHATTRTELLRWLAGREGELMLADNRLDEWYVGPISALEAAVGVPVLRPDLEEDERSDLPEIELVDLSFAYPGGRQVFNGLNFTFEPGSTYHLQGANGSGKSTLSKLLCGLLKPTAGEIRIDGKRVQPWRSPGEAVSYHFQNPSFQLFSRTVSAQLAQADHPELEAMRFGLTEQLEDHPLDLPFVLRKRLALAAAASRRPPFLILDEPTLSQDEMACKGIAKLLRKRPGLRISHSHKFDKLQTLNLCDTASFGGR